MSVEITETEIYIDNMSKSDYDRLNRVASRVAKELGATRQTEKEEIEGCMIYSSSYITESHTGYCFQRGHPLGNGRNIHAHDEFYVPIKKEIEKMQENEE